MIRTRPWPKILDRISTEIGKSRDMVQGPGGNVSWKSDQIMWVKASGMCLADAEVLEIFCKVALGNPLVSIESNGIRPSIEASFHAIPQDAFVIHTHSVGAMTLGFMKTLNDSAMQLLSEFSIGAIEYARPGIALSKKIQEALDVQDSLKGVLLKNHGLVLWGENLEDLYDFLLDFEKKVCRQFPVIEEVSFRIKNMNLFNYLGNRFLTPDHAVFGNDMKLQSLLDEKNWIGDLRYALETSLARIGIDEELSYLSDSEAKELQDWEWEKLRRTLNT